MVRTQFKIHQWILLVLAVFAIAACGGGGGGGGNNTPQFSFTAKSDQALSTVVASNASTVTRIGNSAPVAIQNGEYSIDGGDFVSSAGTISEGQSIVVRGTSSSEFATSVTVTLTIKETSKNFVITTAAQDITPEDFTFAAQTNADLNTEYFSNTVTVTGITGEVDISVENGTYQINESMPTSEAGTITNGLEVIVGGMSSTEFETTTTVTLTIGELEKTFEITTAAQDTTPDVITFTPVTDASLDSEVTSSAVAVSGINSAAVISAVGNAEYSIDGGGFTALAGTINNGQTVAVKGRSASTNSTSTDITVTIGGVNHVFTVTTVADTTPPTAAIVFPTKVSLTDGETLTVRGTAEDLSGIESVTVTVMNGDTEVSQAAAVSFDGEGFARWTAQVTLEADVVNTLVVSVMDTAANTTGEADSVAVTHSSDYFALEFPEDGAGLAARGKIELEVDEENNRLFYSETYGIVQVDMDTGLSAEFVPSDSGFFDSIGGMRVVEETLYFTDLIADRVYKTLLNEVNVSIVSDSSNDNSDADILGPRNLDFTHDGTIYITDAGADSLYSMNPNSGDRVLISDETTPAEGGPAFYTPSHIKIREQQASKKAYVVDPGLDSLIEVDLLTGNRRILTSEGDLEEPSGSDLSFNEEAIYISDKALNKVLSFNLEAESITTLIDGSSGSNKFEIPSGIVLDRDKNLLYFIAGDEFYSCNPLYVTDLETNERTILNKAGCIDPF